MATRTSPKSGRSSPTQRLPPLRHDNLGMPEEPAAAGGGELGEGSEGTEGDPSWVCPKVLFTTSTRDDRVHPAHARKMVSALLEEARPRGLAPVVHYWENIEGATAEPRTTSNARICGPLPTPSFAARLASLLRRRKRKKPPPAFHSRPFF